MKRRTVMITLVLFSAFIVYTTIRFGYVSVQYPGFIPNDFRTFQTAAVKQSQGVRFYWAHEPSPFKYSPTFLLLTKPLFVALPLGASWFIWSMLSAMIFSLVLFRFLKPWLDGNSTQPCAAWITALAIGVGTSWHGYIEHFSYGQVDVFLLSIFLLAAMGFESTQKKLIKSQGPAFLMSLILITKPQTAILLGYFALRGHWNTILKSILFTGALLLAPALVWGWQQHVTYFSEWMMVMRAQDHVFMTGSLSQSLAAAIARVTYHREWVGALTALFLVAGASYVAWASRPWFVEKNRISGAVDRRLAAASILLLYCVITPLSWRWLTFIWMPAVVAVVFELHKDWQKKPFRISAVAFGLFLFCNIIRQKPVALLFGIHEIDELSWVGSYAWASLSLWVSLETVRNYRLRFFA